MRQKVGKGTVIVTSFRIDWYSAWLPSSSRDLREFDMSLSLQVNLDFEGYPVTWRGFTGRLQWYSCRQNYSYSSWFWISFTFVVKWKRSAKFVYHICVTNSELNNKSWQIWIYSVSEAFYTNILKNRHVQNYSYPRLTLSIFLLQ